MDSANAVHCRQRQNHFTESLLNDRPLMPADGGWTYGDLVFLKALVDVMIEEAGRSEMGLPLCELAMRLAAERGQHPN